MTDSLIQAYSNSPRRKKLQILGAFFLVLVILGVLLISHLIVSSRMVGVGRQLQEAKSEMDQLEYINVNLRDKINRAQRMDKLQERAKEMGFRPPLPGEAFYVEVGGLQQETQRAAPEDNPDRTAIINVSRREYHLTLLDWVQEQLRLILEPFEEL